MASSSGVRSFLIGADGLLPYLSSSRTMLALLPTGPVQRRVAFRHSESIRIGPPHEQHCATGRRRYSGHVECCSCPPHDVHVCVMADSQRRRPYPHAAPHLSCSRSIMLSISGVLRSGSSAVIIASDRTATLPQYVIRVTAQTRRSGAEWVR
jgi:hypothetical protein